MPAGNPQGRAPYLRDPEAAPPSRASLPALARPASLAPFLSLSLCPPGNLPGPGDGPGVRRGGPHPQQRAPPGSALCLRCRKARHGVLWSERKAQSERDCEPNRESQAEIGSAGTEAKTEGRDLCSQQSNDRTGATAI